MQSARKIVSLCCNYCFVAFDSQLGCDIKVLSAFWNDIFGEACSYNSMCSEQSCDTSHMNDQLQCLCNMANGGQLELGLLCMHAF